MMPAPASEWVTSTLVFVSDVDQAIGFYRDKLNFTVNMRFEHEGLALVAGVSRGDSCALLLTCQWPDRTGTGILYAAFGKAEHDAILRDFAAAGGVVEEGWWGQALAVVTDPDGNQLYLAVPG